MRQLHNDVHLRAYPPDLGERDERQVVEISHSKHDIQLPSAVDTIHQRGRQSFMQIRSL